MRQQIDFFGFVIALQSGDGYGGIIQVEALDCPVIELHVLK